MKENRIQKLVRTKELWTGIIMVVAAVTIGVFYIQPQIVLPSFAQKQNRIVSPIPGKDVIKKVQQVTPTPVNAEFEVTVKENDSFWEISKRACKTGKYFLDIQDLNTADPYFDGLHAGDKVKVKCSFE